MGVCTMEDERNWFVGVDWASETHHVRVSDARGRKLGARAFAHSGEGLAAMAAWILEVTGAPPEAVFVAIEVPYGPVVESLMERGFRVHAINPKQLAQAARSLPRPLLAGRRQG
jgi:transposase